MYNVSIVEDDVSEADHITELVMRYAKNHGHQFSVSHYRDSETMMASSAHHDLLLLDIDLPGITGMEAATLLRTYDETTPIVFITSLAQYALKGYEVDALGFMVKPISYGGLSMRLDKAVRAMRANERDSLSIQTREGVRVLDLATITYVEAQGHYCIFHLVDAATTRTREAISSMAARLPEDRFVRVSVSHIVNMSQIAAIRSNTITTTTGEEVFISRSRKREALSTIAAYLGRSL